MRLAELAVTHHFADLPGLRMHWVEKGTGPLVVLLHGFPETWWSWRHQLDAVAAAGFRVIAPDQRGYGESGKEGPYDLDTLAGDVHHLVESLGAERRVKIVGHDWGGAVAWHLGAKHPEFVERLVVLNCPHPAVMRRALLTRPSLKQLGKSWYMFFFQLPLLPELLLTRNDAAELMRTFKGMAVDRSRVTEEDVRPFRDAVQRPGAATAMIGWYRAIVREGLRGASPSYPPILCPTTLIWGKGDKALDFDVVVPGTERYAPRLKIVPIEQAGHFVQSERPDEVNAALLRALSA